MSEFRSLVRQACVSLRRRWQQCFHLAPALGQPRGNNADHCVRNAVYRGKIFRFRGEKCIERAVPAGHKFFRYEDAHAVDIETRNELSQAELVRGVKVLTIFCARVGPMRSNSASSGARANRDRGCSAPGRCRKASSRWRSRTLWHRQPTAILKPMEGLFGAGGIGGGRDVALVDERRAATGAGDLCRQRNVRGVRGSLDKRLDLGGLSPLAS